MLADDINRLSGIEFENLCADLLSKLGFQVETTKASGDGGIDIVAYNYNPIYKGKYIIQCKRYSGSVGEPIIRDLYGVIMAERANKGILMTTGTFTNSAIEFAEGKPVELIDGNQVIDLLQQYGLQTANTLRNSVQDILNLLLRVSDSFNEDAFPAIQSLLDLPLTSQATQIMVAQIGLLLYNTAVSFDNCAFSDDERRILLRESVLRLKSFVDRCNINDTVTRKEAVQRYICSWICARASMLLGSFSESQKYYNMILNWKEIKNCCDPPSKDELIEAENDGFVIIVGNNGLHEDLENLLIELLSVYAISGENDKINQLLKNTTYRYLLADSKHSACVSAQATNIGSLADTAQMIVRFFDKIPQTPLFFNDSISFDSIYDSSRFFDGKYFDTSDVISFDYNHYSYEMIVKDYNEIILADSGGHIVFTIRKNH